ncbi:hypothetical protein RRG08_056329 [Elysia crispata]|uniref:Globin n=1 Tax=Elysia crispata TaxID=231223 RepID=A0AAE1D2E7_9GAST|nr:hypothetical protein RRG08_056329 [Elysia crispata]
MRRCKVIQPLSRKAENCVVFVLELQNILDNQLARATTAQQVLHAVFTATSPVVGTCAPSHDQQQNSLVFNNFGLFCLPLSLIITLSNISRQDAITRLPRLLKQARDLHLEVSESDLLGPTMADPVTGLTAQDRQVIQDTWEVVANKQVILDRGVDLFIALFQAHPYMKSYFKDFGDLSIEELKTSPKLRAHAYRTMHGLTQYINAINDVPTLAAYITKIAHSHLSRGIGTLEMDRLAVVFVDYMKVHVGAEWSDEAAAAWTQLLKVHNVVYKGEEDKRSASG